MQTIGSAPSSNNYTDLFPIHIQYKSILLVEKIASQSGLFLGIKSPDSVHAVLTLLSIDAHLLSSHPSRLHSTQCVAPLTLNTADPKL